MTYIWRNWNSKPCPSGEYALSKRGKYPHLKPGDMDSLGERMPPYTAGSLPERAGLLPVGGCNQAFYFKYSVKKLSIASKGILSSRSYKSVWLAPGMTMKILLFSLPGMMVSFL